MSTAPFPPRCELGGAAEDVSKSEHRLLETSADKSQASSWRDRIGAHPAADLFPEMSEADLIELGRDILANGLQQPIILYCEKARRHRRGYLVVPDGEVVVLDGRNRLTAMELVGIEVFDETGHLAPQVDYQDGHKGVRFTYGKWPLNRDAWHPDVEPCSYALSANAHRRHLKPEQKRELIEKLLKAQPEKSDRQIAATVKASPSTVGAIRAEMEEAGTVSKLDTRIGADGVAQPAKKRRLPDPAKSRLKLDLPPRVDASSRGNTDHVEREYTNLITVWNNSADPARAHFLKAIGGSPVPAPSVDLDDDMVEDLKDAIRVFDDAVAFVEQRHAEIKALPLWQRVQRVRRAMDALGVSDNDLIPGGGR